MDILGKKIEISRMGKVRCQVVRNFIHPYNFLWCRYDVGPVRGVGPVDVVGVQLGHHGAGHLLCHIRHCHRDT